MLALLCTLAVTLSAPQGPSVDSGSELPAWVHTGTDDRDADAIVVEGRVELRPSEADRAARDRASEELRMDLERDARSVVESRRPFWMPDVLADRVTERWLARVEAEELVEVLDQRRVARDHGSYRSFQTSLLVTLDAERVDRALDSLGGEVDRSARRLRWQGLGTLGLWGLLGLAWMWLDRLTRGYMTWRLAALSAGMGVALPGIAFLSW